MLSFPHLVVLFVIALVIFGPQKLPELARMLGKATAEFRKMTTDFRYALEDEVRELDRQNRIREEEAAAAARAAQAPPATPEGAVPRLPPVHRWQLLEHEFRSSLRRTPADRRLLPRPRERP